MKSWAARPRIVYNLALGNLLLEIVVTNQDNVPNFSGNGYNEADGSGTVTVTSRAYCSPMSDARQTPLDSLRRSAMSRLNQARWLCSAPAFSALLAFCAARSIHYLGREPLTLLLELTITPVRRCYR